MNDKMPIGGEKPYNCRLCPRECLADRDRGAGFCGCDNKIKIARAALHFWEEPCICSSGGAGAVFFSGCSLKCVYCQNDKISLGAYGAVISAERLAEIFSELEYLGADTIDLVTPTHYTDEIIKALKIKKPGVPVVWNSSGYEKTETLKRLEGLIDIYMPDFKYGSGELAARYSNAPDYPKTALNAVLEMYRQTGDPVTDSDGLMKKGLIVRHLVLPGQLENTFDVMDILTENFKKNSFFFSLMSQYTPLKGKSLPDELGRTLEKDEYERALSYMYLSGIELGYTQETYSAGDCFTPEFDLTGVFADKDKGDETGIKPR